MFPTCNYPLKCMFFFLLIYFKQLLFYFNLLLQKRHIFQGEEIQIKTAVQPNERKEEKSNGKKIHIFLALE